MPATPEMVRTTIELMEQATEANANDAFRTGSLIELPMQGHMMVTGDLHGNVANFRQICRIANLPRFRERHLILQELTHTLIDNEEEICLSYRLIEMAARLKVTFPDNVHILIGNHEISEILNLAIAKAGTALNESFRRGIESAYGDATDDVMNAYRRFMASMPVAVRTENRIFISHSVPPRRLLDQFTLEFLRNRPWNAEIKRKDLIYSMTWGRDYSEETAQRVAETLDVDIVIVGHQKCENGYGVPNSRYIILDSKDEQGCYVIVPLDREVLHAQIVRAIQKIYQGGDG